MKNKLILSLILAMVMVMTSSYAQQTGNINATINFMGQQRTLALYIPPGYNPTQAYRLLIGLHGFGGNGTAFRNGLTSPARNWQGLMPNTIFICPDGSEEGNHYEPAGYEEIIRISINYAKNNYHIDTTNIILEGLSFGGRSALKFGLDHYSEFKGLLLNTPAIQGVMDAVTNIPLLGGDFAYQNADQLPIYITLGENDLPYVPPVDSMFQQLVSHNGIARYFIIPGLDHDIPPTAGPEMQGFLPFLDNPASPAPDAGIIKIKMAKRSCVPTVSAKCWIRNLGADTLHSVKLHYQWNGSTNNYTWNGLLAPFAQTEIALPGLTAVPGVQALDVTLDSVDNIPDIFTENNEYITIYEWMSQGRTLPLTEGFDNVAAFPPEGWLLEAIGDYYIGDWGGSENVKKSGAGAAFCFNTAMIFYNKGSVSKLLSPELDLSTVQTPYLRFDLAYNYHQWGPPVYDYVTNVADTLEVAISTDCGQSWQVLYKKGGSQLSTFPDPIYNPGTVDAAMIDPGPDNWRTDSISLGDYADATGATIKFAYRSARGGSIVLDNVLFSGSPVAIATDTEKNTEIKLWPNPAQKIIHIQSEEAWIKSVSVTDISGRQVIRISEQVLPGQSLVLNTSNLVPGIYFLKIFTSQGMVAKNIVIE